MSFRIENILKKDTAYATRNSFEPVVKNNEAKVKEDTSSRLESVDNCRTGSILQHTLLNRHHPYRSAEENCNIDKLSSSFLPYSCERICFPQSYRNPYFDNDYSPIYTRARFYPTYITALPGILPLQYSYYSKRKGGQVRFTANQTDILEKRFLTHKYLSPEDRKLLADDLKLSDRQVKTWFQNRRAKWRRSNSYSSTEQSVENEKINTKSEISKDPKC